jgi:hypothetical protein
MKPCFVKLKRLDAQTLEYYLQGSAIEKNPRKAARNANKKMSKLKKDLADSYDEEEAENSDDKDFIVDDEMVIDVSEDESEDSDDSDDSDSAEKSKKKKKTKKAKKKSKSSPGSSRDSDLEAYKQKQEQKLLKEKEKKAKKEKSDDDTVSPKSSKVKKPNTDTKKGIKYEDCEEESEKGSAIEGSVRQSSFQYEDEDTVENKNYIDVLKKYFGYKSFRP